MPARSGRWAEKTSVGTAREVAVQTYLHRWAETAGVRLLLVDPGDDDPAADSLKEAMAARGVHVTWVGSTIEGLVEFGHLEPHAVVVAPDAPGIPATEFVTVIRDRGASFVIAAIDHDRADEVGELMLAGAGAVVPRPYEAAQVWEVLTHAPRGLDEHARVEVGPIELDSTAYTVRIHGERIADLPLKEFELLRALMLRAPGVLTDDELRDALWGRATRRRPRDSAIAMHVTRLRARLGAVATVRRIRGRGYSLTVG